jgi:alkylated DNA repair dioxygenase AlkB
MGDPDAVYVYSGSRFVPHPWPGVLVPIRERLERELGALFNSVLGNLYRDGNDRLGWHRDGERELGPTPVIASVSLGATRRFRFRARKGATSLGIDLTHGSLLVMSGHTQDHYLHSVPKTARAVGPRINLTFRHVIPRTATPAP